MEQQDIFRLAHYSEDVQYKTPEYLEYERKAIAVGFASLVDDTILENIEEVRFNMYPPYEDSLSLLKRKTGAADCLVVQVKRKQNIFKRGYDATLPEYVLKSVNIVRVESDHVVDSLRYDLLIDGSVHRYCDDPRGEDGRQGKSITLEEVHCLHDLLSEK